MKHLRLVIVIVALFALMGVQAVWAAPAEAHHGGGVVHVVRCGDTLYSIARAYGTTVSAIASANGIYNPNLIYVGQRLVIPGGGGHHGGGYPPPPPHYGCRDYYRVHYGNTLYGIARWYGTSAWAIANANGIRNPNYIYAGQVLCIP